jgi:glycosyl transferase family 87
MTRRLHDNAVALLGAALGTAAIAWVGLVGFAWSDYDYEAAPAFKALTDGHISRFLQLAPAYGGSFILRAPFALLPGLWGGGEIAVYRMVALPCLLAAAVLGVWLVARLRALGASKLTRATALGVCVANPITVRALEIGHPEELLGGVLCVAAMLAALGRRATLAGVLLGLAVATKSWALVAVAPVLVALPARRWRALLISAAVALVITAPLVGAGSSGFVTTNRAAAQTGVIFQPWQAWWFTGSHGKVVRGLDNQIKVGYRSAPGWLSNIPHPLIVLLPLPLALLWLRRRKRSRAPVEDALLLLALALLLRCLLDPWNNVYYELPFLLVLLSWETLVRRAPPVLTLASSAILWAIFQMLPGHVSPDLQSLAYLGWSLPLALGLGLRLYAPERAGAWLRAHGRPLSTPVSRRRSVPSAAR